MGLIANGDQAALSMLITRHGHALTVLATRYLGNRAEAEDVVQEVWLQVWRQAREFDPARARLTTWCYRVTANLCFDRMRRARIRSFIGLGEMVDDPPDSAPLAAQIVEARETLAQARAAVRRLPDRQRMALLLAVVAGMEAAQIAGVMGTSRGAVEQLLSRARRTVRKRLMDETAPSERHG